jgi:hypothetical protein
MVIPVFFAMPVLGCVSSGTYKAAKKEIQDLQHELQQERLKLQTIEKVFGERIKQMENLVSRLNSSVERYDGMAKNWSDLRNELTMLRVSRELERQKGGGGIGIVLEGDLPSNTPDK